MIKQNRLVGAVLIGDQTLSPLVQRLIDEQVNLSPVLPALQKGDHPLSDTLLRLAGEVRQRNIHGPGRTRTGIAASSAA
jgi:hypothetical protein